MRVIVHHHDPIAVVPAFEPSFGAGKRGHCGRHFFKRHAELICHRHRRQRVHHVLFAGNHEFNFTEPLAPANHREPAAAISRRDVERPVIRLVGQTKRNRRATFPCQRHTVRAVSAIKYRVQRTAEKRSEIGQQRRHRAVVIEVFRFDIQADGELRRKSDQGAIALTRFRHKILTGAELGIGAEHRHIGANTKTRGAVTPREHMGDQGRRRGLPVRPGHRDIVFVRHQRRQQLPAPHRRNFQFLCRNQFLISTGHSRGEHNQLGAWPHIFAGVADENFCAEFLQPGRLAVRRQIGAGHRVALLQQQPGQAAHPAPANANKMHMAALRAEKVD